MPHTTWENILALLADAACAPHKLQKLFMTSPPVAIASAYTRAIAGSSAQHLVQKGLILRDVVEGVTSFQEQQYQLFD